ncbi:hypothetical protein [Candidatus Amarobacter glycogenicus]|nr:hypothetical protein [Dehalococcoidia bacterium]
MTFDNVARWRRSDALISDDGPVDRYRLGGDATALTTTPQQRAGGVL